MATTVFLVIVRRDLLLYGGPHPPRFAIIANVQSCREFVGSLADGSDPFEAFTVDPGLLKVKRVYACGHQFDEAIGRQIRPTRCAHIERCTRCIGPQTALVCAVKPPSRSTTTNSALNGSWVQLRSTGSCLLLGAAGLLVQPLP